MPIYFKIYRIRSPLFGLQLKCHMANLFCSLLCNLVRAVMGSKKPESACHHQDILSSRRSSMLCNSHATPITCGTLWKRKYVKVMQPPPFAHKQIQKPPKSQLEQNFVNYLLGLQQAGYCTVIMQIVMIRERLNLKKRLQGFPLYTVTSCTSPPSAENALENNSWLSCTAWRENCILSVCWWRIL